MREIYHNDVFSTAGDGGRPVPNLPTPTSITATGVNIYGQTSTATYLPVNSSNWIHCKFRLGGVHQDHLVKRILARFKEKTYSSVTLGMAEAMADPTAPVAAGGDTVERILLNGVYYRLVDVSKYLSNDPEGFFYFALTATGSGTVDIYRSDIDFIVEYEELEQALSDTPKITGNTSPRDSLEINTLTGRGTYKHTVLSVDSPRIPWELAAVFDPKTCDKTSIQGFPLFANSWRWNMSQAVYANGTNYMYWDGDRKLHRFEPCANNASVYYETSENSGLYLTVSGSTVVITDDVSVRLTFSSGRLTTYATLGVGASSISLSYDSSNRLSSITDDMGDTYTITYGTNQITVSLGTVPIATLALSSSRLASITRKNRAASTAPEPTTQFTYDTTGLLTDVYATDTRGQMSITYNASRYIVNLLNGTIGDNNILRSERYLTLEYNARHTAVKYALQYNTAAYKTINYVFDEEGHCTDSYESDSGTPNTCSSTKHKSPVTMSIARNTDVLAGSFAFARSGYFDITGSYNQTQSVTIQSGGLGDRTKSYLIVIEAEMLSSATDMDAYVSVEWDGKPVKRYVDLADRTRQKICLPVNTRGSNTITLRIQAGNFNGTCRIYETELYVCNGTDAVDCVTQNTGYTAELTANSKTWYPIVKCNVTYQQTAGGTTYTLSNVYLTAQDVNRTKQARVWQAQHAYTGWNVWYGDGKMLCNVVSCVYQINNQNYNLKDFCAARLAYSNNRYGYGYVEADVLFSQYVVYACKAADGVYAEGRVYYNSDHQTIQQRTPEGTMISVTYNNGLPITNLISATGGTPTGSIRTDMTRNTYGQITSQTSYRNSSTNTSDYAYNANHRLATRTTPLGYAYSYTYQGADPDKLIQLARNGSFKNDIDYVGELISSFVNASGAPITLGYNQYYEPTSVGITGNSYSYALTKSFTYNVNGTVLTVTTKGGQIIRRTYDKYGRLVKIEKGIPTSYSTVRTYIYNDGPISSTSVTSPDDPTLTISGSSKLYRVCDWIDSELTRTDYVYNEFGELTELSVTRLNSQVYKLVLTYDLYGRVQSYCLQQGTTVMVDRTYTYYSAVDDRVSHVTNASGTTLSVQMQTEEDALGRTTSKTLNTTAAQTYQQKRDYEYYTANVGGQTADVQTVTHTLLHNDSITHTDTESVQYDADGNITQHGSTHYTYDAYNRLIREDNYAMGKSYTYEYDAAGNITYKRTYAYTLGTLGTPESTLTFTYDTTWKDLLLSVGGQTCTYNTAGQPTTYKGNSFTWLNGQLRFAHGATLYYDGNGIRSGKDDIKYYYQDGKLLWQTDGTNTLYFLYDGDEVIGFRRQVLNTKTTYLYRRNVLGDIVAIYNTSNALQARYVYDAWGNHKVLNPNGTVNNSDTFIGNINPLRYRGYYYDADLGLYYLMTRYYDPAACRFISADGIEYLDPETLGGLNLFAYCNNNPVMGVDPDGTFGITALLVLIGVIAGATIGGVVTHQIAEEQGADEKTTAIATIAGVVGGGALGGLIGYIAAPLLGAGATGGGLALAGGAGVVGGAIAVSGAEIAVVAGSAITSLTLVLFSKGQGPRHGHNQRENDMWNDAMKKLGIKDKDTQQRLHRYNGRKPYANTFHELLEQLKEIIEHYGIPRR